MIKINKNQKSTLAILLLCLFMAQNLNASLAWSKMQNCRHVKICFLTASVYYEYMARLLPYEQRYALARYLTIFLRSRNLAFFQNNTFDQGTIISLPSMKNLPPHQGYTHRVLESNDYNFELSENDEHEEEKINSLLQDEDRDPHTLRISRVNTMAEAIPLACEGSKIDNNFFSTGLEVINMYYQNELRRVHYLETGENRDPSYFALKCLTKPKPSHGVDETNLGLTQKIMVETQLENSIFSMFHTFDLGKIDFPESIDKVTQIVFAGETYDDHNSVTHTSSNYSDSSNLDALQAQNDAEIESIIESVF